MTKDEALRLALEALEKTQSALARCMGPHKSEEGDRHRALAYSRTTISAIKAALEAKDEPVAWMRTSGTGSPVVTEELLIAMPEMRWNFQQPLYTTPPQRKWVGLTDEERGQVYADWRFNGGNSSNLELCRAIEAKLKEKNT